MSQTHPPEDHYATLGVPPRSEASAIRAAYLDLMRRFHPDRNDSPEAVDRAHAIIAAFAVLGNVEQRLHYDWARRRAADDAAEAERRRPAMIRKALIAAALMAILMLPLSFIAFGGPDSEPQARPPAPKVAAKTPIASLKPVAAAKPRVDQLPAASLAPTVTDPPPPEPPIAQEPASKADEPAPPPTPPPQPLPPRETRQARNAVKPPPVAPANPRCRTLAPGAEARICNNNNLTALDRSVVAFYNQSLQYGDPAKRGPLLDARIGFLLKREECRSDACLQGVHLAHLRELASIVEKGQPVPPR